MSSNPNQGKNEVTQRVELGQDEQILWQSKTGQFSLLSGFYRSVILRQWLISTVVILGLIGAYVANVEEISTKVIGFLLLILVFLLVSPITEWKKLQGQQYILTNQRAILVKGGHRFFSMPFQNIDDAQLVQITPNENCLILGSKMTAEPKRRLRFWAANPREDVNGGGICGLVFYAIQDANRALQLVSSHMAA